MTKKFVFLFVAGVLFTAVSACNSNSTPGTLSDIKLGLDETAGNARTTFSPKDKIYAVSALNNTGGKHQVRFRLLFDDVEGADPFTVAYQLEKKIDVEGGRTFWYTFSVPDRGLVPGSYIAEFVLLGDDGWQGDTKSATFTVNRAGSPPPTDSGALSTDKN